MSLYTILLGLYLDKYPDKATADFEAFCKGKTMTEAQKEILEKTAPEKKTRKTAKSVEAVETTETI